MKIKKINNLNKKNNKIILLSGDIGNRLFDEFKQKCPNQFYNCGVAENNMIGDASGLSKLGFIPFVYTITPFLVSRSFEQIKLDVAYPNLNVTIVGTGAGLSYARLGATHHSLDDLMLMKSLPNMKLSRQEFSKWNKEKGHYDISPIDWDEFWNVVKGNGAGNRIRLAHHVKAHDDGAWVREAAIAYRNKLNSKQKIA